MVPIRSYGDIRLRVYSDVNLEVPKRFWLYLLNVRLKVGRVYRFDCTLVLSGFGVNYEFQ